MPGFEASGKQSVAAQSLGVAVTGDNARVVVLPPQAVQWAKEVEAAPGTANLPGSTSGVFVGRDDALDLLRGLLAGAGDVAVTQTGAVHGLGGIGKSTLALHYAIRYRDAYSLTWWINAESPESIEVGLSALTVRLCPYWARSATTDERMAWAVTWLQWHPDWLLIFDNVEHPDQLRPYLGSLRGGHHLATSRKATGWHAIGPTLPLDLLGSEASADLLCSLAYDRQTPTPEQRKEAEHLAAELGYLPLALEQAGAYLHQTGKGIGAYRRALPRMLPKHSEGIDPERTVARVWNQSIQAIRERGPLAVTLLNAAAWLAPDDIPRALLAPLAPTVDEADDEIDDALGVLRAYNMITLSGPTFSVHRLVQAVLRTPPAADSDHLSAGRVDAELALHAAVFNGDDAMSTATTWQWEALAPHITAFAINLSPASATVSTFDIFDRAAENARQAGQTARAIPLFEATLAQYEEVLGDTHPDTLRSRNNLALAYRSAGDLARATPLYEATLAQREEILGDTHPDTLTSRNNLAYVYESAGDLARAIPLFEATLAQYEQVLGDTHPDTLRSRNDLAGAYEGAGDLARAIPLFEATLAQREEVLGDTHPHTLRSRNDLAGAYRSAGDLARAIPLFEATLAQYEQVLGDTHPDTLTSRNNLAGAYRSAGQTVRAIPLFKATLAQYEQVLGDTHPNTLRSRNNLALAYEGAGDLARAIPLFEATLAQYEQVLGDTHPNTLTSRNNLALAYRSAGDLARAIPLFEATLAQYEQVLGDTHPNTLTSRNNLAGAYESAGDLARAIPLFEATLAQYEQVLGDTHPDTLTSRNNLAYVYESAGDLARAIPLFEATLAQYEQVLGDTHPDTLTSRNNLARAKAAER
ncbi:tetratricopeptide repeat protein [Streptomyces laculatispora]|uniref:Tetratricopeptide repeat protein n=1 Tax=Streptomyces laculatispora TaxID=887464 RepID=A0ABY9IE42_9ACTN|nr:tetratricopeptide repeat protein [Streptomyces laculatispora]WLQ45186.1 tetratricopeptide repeat protein [Streptomyces laculatispora]